VPNQQFFAIRPVFGVSLQIECAFEFVYWNVNFLPSDCRNASKGPFSPRELQKVQHVNIDSHRQDSFRWGYLVKISLTDIPQIADGFSLILLPLRSADKAEPVRLERTRRISSDRPVTAPFCGLS
jgi:hypothetical protein